MREREREREGGEGEVGEMGERDTHIVDRKEVMV